MFEPDSAQRHPTLIERYGSIPKIPVTKEQRTALEEWSQPLKRQAEKAVTSLRRFDLEAEVGGADFLLHQIDEIGGIPRDSARKKQFFEEVITGIGGWPDRIRDQGVTLNNWRMTYHNYLGLTEACNILDWKPEDQSRTAEEILSYLGGETQRAINVLPQPSIPHVEPIK